MPGAAVRAYESIGARSATRAETVPYATVATGRSERARRHAGICGLRAHPRMGRLAAERRRDSRRVGSLHPYNPTAVPHSAA